MTSLQIASPGMALGYAYIHVSSPYDIAHITTQNPHQEIDVLSRAIDLSIEDIKALKAQYTHEDKDVFDAHILMLKDPELFQKTTALIEDNHMNAAFAFKTITDQYINHFNSLNDTYFKLRATDVIDIQRRVLNHLTKQAHHTFPIFTQPTIILADTLTPSDIAQLDLTFVKGLITEDGGTTSHVAIMAQSLNIPFLMNAPFITSEIKTGDLILLDAINGSYAVDPDHTTIEKVTQYTDKPHPLDDINKLSMHVSTEDNHTITLKANIAHPKEWIPYANHPTLGIGLLRTEFLYFNTTIMPSIDSHIADLLPLFKQCHDVTVRTMDVGSDKPIHFLPSEKEDNPALGLRGIRYSLKHTDIFRIHLESLLRASKDCKQLNLMLPMITSVSEITATKALIESIQKRLKETSVDYQSNVQFGMMIETPIAAFNITSLSKHIDFFSIGTNDLLHYIYASDRTQSSTLNTTSYFDPPFLTLLQSIITHAKANNKPISVCGEMAHDPYASLLLIGLGIETLSMSPIYLKTIHKNISSHTYKTLKTTAKHVLSLTHSDQVIEYVKAKLKPEIS